MPAERAAASGIFGAGVLSFHYTVAFKLDSTTHLLVGQPLHTHLRTPNHSGPFRPGALDTLMLHYTGAGDAQEAAEWLCNPNSKASAHLVVGRDGAVFQLLPFNHVAWHAGPSSHNGRQGLNQYSIGIEIDNPGQLVRDGDRYYTYFRKEIAPEDVAHLTHRHHSTPSYWQTYTPAQVETVFQITQLLVREYGLKHVVGHEEVSPGRKVDPGPAFPLDDLRRLVLGEDRSQDSGNVGRVTANALSVRKSPNLNAEIEATLPQNSLVDVMDQTGDWLLVHIAALGVTGWVHERYVDLYSLS